MEPMYYIGLDVHKRNAPAPGKRANRPVGIYEELFDLLTYIRT
jgi:hypothetical protein